MSARAAAAADVRFVAHDDIDAWATASATALADALRHDLRQRPRSRLLLSGGRTPAPAYAALAKASLDWSRVDIALVDERWLQPDDPDSNARLIRETLLHDNAAAARFESLTRAGRNIADAVAAANLMARQPAAVITLGMGDDGHTASLFPGMRGFDAALASGNAYVAVDASGCEGAGQWRRRISLTPAGLATAQARVLLIRGASKRALFERAMTGDDVRQLPIRFAFTTPGAALQVHWCA
ncbi:MAG: 6-phosphogluconolactonase [Luteimonas sp.]